MPRWSLGCVNFIQAAAFGWAAFALPWSLTIFTGVTALLAALQLSVAVLAVLRARQLPKVWRSQCWASLAYLAYLTWGLLASASYLNSLYSGIGSGMAALLLVAVLPVVLLTLPSACWGLAKTGGVRVGRGAAGAIAVIALVGAAHAAVCGRRALLDAQPSPVTSAEQFAAQLAQTLQGLPTATAAGATLYTTEPVQCERPIDAQQATLVVTYVPRGTAEPISKCLQKPTSELLASARQILDGAEPGYARFDLVSGARALWSPFALLEPLALRPALDGVCAGTQCLLPWQLVALDVFTQNQPLRAIPDLRFGVSRAALLSALHQPHSSGAADAQLTRIETFSATLTPAGAVSPDPLVTLPAQAGKLPDALRSAAAAAERFVQAAQLKSGQFAYLVDPFTGDTPDAQLVLSRQAGTTLAWCEHASSPDKKRVAERSLALLARRAREYGAVSALSDREKDVKGRLGQNALPLAAFLRCRALVGERYDALIGQLARLLLQQQRADGGFVHGIDLRTARPKPGPNTLYADGQAILALSLLEGLGADQSPHFPAQAETRAAVERAMNYVGGPYWQFFAGQFFFVAENWHCIAAAASLPYHRNDAYERFCIDYMTFQQRLRLDPSSGVRAEYLGGHGLGNLFPPHTTPTSGHVEALTAAIAVKRARGLEVSGDLRALEELLGFLLRNQWTDANCFACSRQRLIIGAFSENAASPKIRIDYVQHAWSALATGMRALGAGADA